jgi:hypothetical protein
VPNFHVSNQVLEIQGKSTEPEAFGMAKLFVAAELSCDHCGVRKICAEHGQALNACAQGVAKHDEAMLRFRCQVLRPNRDAKGGVFLWNAGLGTDQDIVRSVRIGQLQCAEMGSRPDFWRGLVFLRLFLQPVLLCARLEARPTNRVGPVREEKADDSDRCTGHDEDHIAGYLVA